MAFLLALNVSLNESLVLPIALSGYRVLHALAVAGSHKIYVKREWEVSVVWARRFSLCTSTLISLFLIIQYKSALELYTEHDAT